MLVAHVTCSRLRGVLTAHLFTETYSKRKTKETEHAYTHLQYPK